MTKYRTVIFGNGELAAINHHYLTRDTPHEAVAFTVDGAFITEDRFLGLPVVPFEEIELTFPPEDNAFSLLAGFRDVNRFRSERYGQVKAKGYSLISYVSSKAIVSPGAMIGESSHVYEGAIVQPFARIGSNVVVSPAAMVGHHVVVEDHCFLSSQVTILGSVRIGSHGVIGAAATILDDVSVAPDCIIGSGVVLGKDTKAKEVHIGQSPHKIARTSDQFARMLTWFSDSRARPQTDGT